MSIEKREPTNRTSITIVVVVVLVVAALAYSQGWFNRASTNDGTESNNVRTDQRIDQEKTNEDAVRLTKETADSAPRPIR
jgi:hypothetical protein